ncbi:MAG: cytochrome c-type biogenesis protein [Solirubrobacteraceae bacterium]
MIPGRGTLALALLVLFVAAAAPETVALAAAQAARASLTDVEGDVMCPSCREPLALAQSPQAIAERAYIRRLIARGLTKRQIESNLVGQYTQAVLGRPPASGFNLTVYILPPAIVLLGVALLAVNLPRWRRRARATAAARAARAAADPAPQLDENDVRRLDEDLARHP